MGDIIRDTWHGCYNDSYQGILIEQAFSHPAKMALGLARRIFAHAKTEGWLPTHSVVLDPFAGVGTTALQALLHGCAFVGNELEPKFFSLAQENIAKWCAEYATLPGFGPWAMVTCGDSRELTELVPSGVSACVASPPYAASLSTEHSGIDWAKQRSNNPGHGAGQHTPGKGAISANYGRNPANLGNLPAGHLDLVVASPPYATGDSAGAESLTRRTDASAQAMRTCHGWTGGGQTTPGNLAALPLGAVVSSPPWEDQEPSHAQSDTPSTQRLTNGATKGRTFVHAAYGDHPDQLGNRHGDTFWEAAGDILSQTYQTLRHGAHAIWVTKRYIRDGAIVEFTADWIRLCARIGFQPLHHHRAMLIEDHGTQTNLFGGADTQHQTLRASFFRRLHMKKRPDLAILWEDVTCFVKPGRAGKGMACAVSSPPYNLPMSQDHNGTKGGTRGTTPSEHGAFAKYGSTPGQLEGLPMGSLDACIASPPYAGSLHGQDDTLTQAERRARTSQPRTGGGPTGATSQIYYPRSYGTTPGQLGAMREGETPTAPVPNEKDAT